MSVTPPDVSVMAVYPVVIVRPHRLKLACSSATVHDTMKERMMTQKKSVDVNNDPRAEESKKILERVARESETVGTSSFTRTADRLRGHFGAEDADQERWAEVWGTRIGRTLGALFFIGLVIYLLRTYVLNV